MPKVRPEIDEDLIRKIKCEYTKETAMLSVAGTVDWALKQLLKRKQA